VELRLSCENISRLGIKEIPRNICNPEVDDPVHKSSLFVPILREASLLRPNVFLNTYTYFLTVTLDK
jgi:hypothetical protein